MSRAVAIARPLGAAAVVIGISVGIALSVRSGDDSAAPEAPVDAPAPSTSTTTTSTTTTTTTTTTTLPPPRTATLVFSGDLLPHMPVVAAAARHAEAAGADGWDFRPMFEEVRPLISAADLAICHLEAPISYDDSDLTGYPVFNAPRALVEGAAHAGYDGCSVASNHSYDRSASGVIGTLDAMDEIGVGHAGMARSEAEDLAPRLYDANGISVAHISATYGLNGFVLPEDRQYLVDLIEPAEILREAALARQAGAEFVVVSLHWGSEYRHEPSTAQEDWLVEILPSPDVDLVVGHHAHVVQPIDRLDGEWVVYGLGNFLSNQSRNCCVSASQDGMIAAVDITENREAQRIEVSSVGYTPTWVDRHDGYLIRVARPGRSDVGAEVAAALEASQQRTAEVVGSRLGPAEEPAVDFGTESAVG